MSNQLCGRRVFFVYPPSVVEDQMIQFLVSAQLEVAIVKDVEKIDAIIRKYPRAIFYFDIEATLKEEDWEKTIRKIVADSDRTGVDVGIISYNENPELAQKYLMDIGIGAGYVQLKLGFAQSAKIILTTLMAVEAKGRRQFLRVTVPTGKGSVNIRQYGRVYEGGIIDVSIAGMACYLDSNLEKGDYIQDMQLRLWGSLLSVSGKVAGTRDQDDRRVHVIMFDSTMTSEAKGKIMKFLRRLMQLEVDSI